MGLRVPFFFSGGVFYWDEKPEQKKVYTFERGVNILNLRRAGGVWELETVSAPFIKHSHKINLIHPQVSGEVEVSRWSARPTTPASSAPTSISDPERRKPTCSKKWSRPL